MSESTLEAYASIISKFSTLTERKKLEFLLRISYELTIVARDLSTYKNQQLQFQFATGISEINHKILGYVLRKMADENSKGYSADQIFPVVLDMINGYGLSPWKHCLLVF